MGKARCGVLGRVLLALLLTVPAASSLGAGAVPVPSAAQAPDLLLALEVSAPAQRAQRAWLDGWARELGARGDLRVGDRVLLERWMTIGLEASDRMAELRRRAVEGGRSHLVFARVVRSGASHTVDVRVVATDSSQMLSHLVYEAERKEGVVRALGRALEGVRTALLPAPPAPSDRIFARPAFGPEGPLEPDSEPESENGEASAAPRLSRAGPESPDVSAAPPPAPSSSPAVVAQIRVEGNRRVDADAIRAVVGTRVGGPLSRARVAEDVHRIYELGFFHNVQVGASASPEGAIVTYLVEENPIIRQVSVSGNENVGADDLKEQLTLTVGSTIDYPLLRENEARIEAFYKAQGFHRVEVQHRIDPLGEGAVAVDFAILEGQKLRLRRIEFRGNDHLDDDELRKGLQTRAWSWKSLVTHYWDHSGVYAEPLFFQDLDRIQRRYMDEGYIRVRVGEPEVEITDDGLVVVVPITEGPRYSVGEVDLTGDESMDQEELRAQIELSPGEFFSRARMTGDVERLRGYYSDRGFFSARVIPRTRVDEDDRTVACLFEVDKGELYFVDRIEVHGNTRTRDHVIRRELGLVEGELYSARALERSRARVRRLGFFEEVDLQTQVLEDENLVGVDVDVVERPTGSFSFGAGFGSTDGFLVNASVSQENLFGSGYGLVANVDLGTQNKNLFLRFTDPYFMGSMASLSGTLQTSKREFLDFDQEIMGFSFNVGYPLDEGETRAGSGYTFSQREITGIEEFQASSMLQREEFQGSTSTSMLSLSLLRDTRDDIRFPKQGQISGVGIEFAGVGGLTSFLRLEGRTTWFLPVRRWLGFESTFVVNSRIGWAVPLNSLSDFDLPECLSLDCQKLLASSNGQLQALTNIDTDLKLPLSERYFLGGLGAFQLRGFKQRSVGPRRTILNRFDVAGTNEVLFRPSNRVSVLGSDGCIDGTNGCNDITDKDIDDFENLDLTDVIGGNKMFLLNFELQFPISEELGLMGLIFLDMGNAFAENESINPADFRFGTGAGVQWFSPFGPIMVQLGFPLDRLEDEDGSVFEFSMGGSRF